jgi:hypothetical protein
MFIYDLAGERGGTAKSARGTRFVIVSVIPIINTIVVNVEPTASISRDRITVLYQHPYHSS